MKLAEYLRYVRMILRINRCIRLEMPFKWHRSNQSRDDSITLTKCFVFQDCLIIDLSRVPRYGENWEVRRDETLLEIVRLWDRGGSFKHISEFYEWTIEENIEKIGIFNIRHRNRKKVNAVTKAKAKHAMISI